MSFTWQYGRQLATATKNGVTSSYVYNRDGGRHSKTVGGVTTQFYSVDGVLYGQKTGTNSLVFLYDEAGTPYGFKYNSTPYYYNYNLQGDVVGIFNSSGTQIVTYTYDPWGKILSVTDTSTNSIGTVNPLRYRGYYYDEETGLYYCNSRYYDPEIGRWINADGVISGTSGSIQGYNMFAYCFNNPINMTDGTGAWPSWNDITNGFKKAKEWLHNNVYQPVANFFSDIAADIGKLDINNTDVAEVYNANYISAYKGKPVVLLDSEFLTSAAISGTLFLNHQDDDLSLSKKTEIINHEYGHIQQEGALGTRKYITSVFLPSATYNLLSRISPTLRQHYYDMPWEYNADKRGNVSRNHSSWAGIVSDIYFLFVG